MITHSYQIPGLLSFQYRKHEDDRGYFSEIYQQKRYQEYLGDIQFVQDNLSVSRKGTLRGLHFQRDPHAQGKLVMVVSGRIFDVCVDLRYGSPSFGHWEGVELSDENCTQLYIPAGCAHGFLVLSDTATFQYKCTGFYHKESEGSVLWSDPTINIQWPLDAKEISLSPKDEKSEPFDPQKIYFNSKGDQ